MKQLLYKQIKIGVTLFTALVLSSSFILADFQNVDCIKNQKVLGISTAECKVLEKLWESTNGEDWLENKGWDSLSSVSTWDGVVIENSKVSSLLLYSNNLKGKIPSELGELSDLKRLSLSHNMLSGEIPTSIGLLSQLHYLELSDNSLSAVIPSSLGSLSQLTELYINNNQLSGTIPDALGDLESLEVLKLYENNLEGEIPLTLGALSNLDSLSLAENNLTGTIPSTLGELAKLTYLDLKSNHLSGEIPLSFGNLEALTGLYLQHNRLVGEIPSQLGALSRLSDLDLSDNELSDSIPTSLGGLSHLTYLNLAHNQLSGNLPVELLNLDILNYLNLNSNQFIPSNLEELDEEFSYIPNYSISYNQNSEELSNKAESVSSFNELVKEDIEEIRKEPTPLSLKILNEEELAMLEVATLKLVGTEEAGEDLEVVGEGRWSLEDEIISFIPLSTFPGTPSSVFYTIKDADGMESAPIEVSIKSNQDTSLLVNILDKTREGNISYCAQLQPSAILEEENVLISLSEDAKRLTVEGEGVWKLEDNGTTIFIPEEGFESTPTQIKYLIVNENGEKSTVGLIAYKTTEYLEYDSSNNVGLFGFKGLLLMMLFGGLFGMFYIREIENKKI